MSDITIFDDNSQTETTLILNNNKDVIGVETYFVVPRQISAFFNKNETFKVQHKKVTGFPTRTSLSQNANRPLAVDNGLISSDPGEYSQSNSNVRFEVTKATPCGGPRQRPCK